MTSPARIPFPMPAEPVGVPVADVVLVLAVIAAGGAAAWVADPALWYVTPAVAGVLLVASNRGRVRALQAESGAPELLPDLRRTVDAAMDQLPDGGARRLLDKIMRPARSVFAARESAFDERHDTETRRNVADLVGAACAIALDLARLDAVSPPNGPAGDQLQERYESARRLLTKRLEDAASALGALYAAGLERGTPASDRVADLASELREDASARAAARREMEQLRG